MSAPRTLMSMYGLSPIPSALSKSVVVLIDVQNDYRGAFRLNGVDEAAGVIAKLLERARAAGTPVVHVVQRGSAGGLFDLDAEGGAIMTEATPAAGEVIVVKNRPSSFFETDLLDRVRATGREELILAGFMTHMCVSTTARDALDHCLRTTIVADAVASRDLPDPLGGDPIPGETISRVALAELADRFAIVAPLDAIPD